MLGELSFGAEATIGDVGTRRRIPSTRHVPRPWINRTPPGEAVGRASIEDRQRTIERLGERLLGDDAIGWPLDRREHRRRRAGGPVGRWPVPDGEPAVEHRSGTPKRIEHPPQSRGDQATRIVIGDDLGGVADAEAAHRVGERRSGGKRVSAGVG